MKISTSVLHKIYLMCHFKELREEEEEFTRYPLLYV